MILLQRIGARVPQNYTIELALRAAIVTEQYDTVKLVRAIFGVLTESQQVRVLEQLGWAVCPGPTIAVAPVHHPV